MFPMVKNDKGKKLQNRLYRSLKINITSHKAIYQVATAFARITHVRQCAAMEQTVFVWTEVVLQGAGDRKWRNYR